MGELTSDHAIVQTFLNRVCSDLGALHEWDEGLDAHVISWQGHVLTSVTEKTILDATRLGFATQHKKNITKIAKLRKRRTFTSKD